MYNLLGGVGIPCPWKSYLVPGHNNGGGGLSPCLVPSLVDEGSWLSVVAPRCNICRLDCLCRAGFSHLQ
jgi:hypothetical protein